MVYLSHRLDDIGSELSAARQADYAAIGADNDQLLDAAVVARIPRPAF